MRIPTMTLADLVLRLRSLGIHTDNRKAAAMIESGQYPFATCVRYSQDGQRVFEIYQVLFEQWARGRMVLEPGDPGYQVPLELCPQHTTQEAS